MAKKVLVLGECCSDRFVVGDCNRLAPEGPIIVLNERFQKENPGMAGNTARNIITLSSGLIELLTLYQSTPLIRTRFLEEKSGRVLLRVDSGDDKVKEVDSVSINSYAAYNLEAIVVSDYGKGFLSRDSICSIGRNFDCPIFLDTKYELGSWSTDIDFVKINTPEFNRQPEEVRLNPTRFCKNLIVTDGGNDVHLFASNGLIMKFPAAKMQVSDVTGCGDTFLAGLVVNYLQTRDIVSAIQFANKAAAVAASKPGVVAVSHDEVEERFNCVN